MTVAASTSETSENFHQTTGRNNPEDSHLHTRRRENLKSHLIFVYVCVNYVCCILWRYFCIIITVLISFLIDVYNWLCSFLLRFFLFQISFQTSLIVPQSKYCELYLHISAFVSSSFVYFLLLNVVYEEYAFHLNYLYSAHIIFTLLISPDNSSNSFISHHLLVNAIQLLLLFQLFYVLLVGRKT
jgi:hypothetical protein